MRYNVNEKTLAILPIGLKKSKIFEKSRIYELKESSFSIIEGSCEHFGVSYNTRLRNTINTINSKYKNPIIIEDYHRIIFFPISSPTRSNTIWVSFNNIVDYVPSSRKNNTIVKFNNGQKLEIPISFYSFNQQYLKASNLSSKMTDRIFRK